jgi:hypothetical protein
MILNQPARQDMEDPMDQEKRCQCGQLVDARRASWADTCSTCAGRGCGARWLHGAPIRRCHGCDCMPPDSFLIPPAMRPRIEGKLRIRL